MFGEIQVGVRLTWSGFARTGRFPPRCLLSSAGLRAHGSTTCLDWEACWEGNRESLSWGPPLPATHQTPIPATFHNVSFSASWQLAQNRLPAPCRGVGVSGCRGLGRCGGETCWAPGRPSPGSSRIHSSSSPLEALLSD